MSCRLRRLVIAALLAVGPPGAAAAAPTQASDPAVEAIVAKADPAAMKVVWMTEDAKGKPTVHAAPVRDTLAARAVVARQLRDPDTVAVSMDQPRKAVATNDPLRRDQWALDALQADRVYPLGEGNAPTQVRVAVVDSGVFATHPDLASNVLPGYDAISGVEGPTTDSCGHGTHVAGIVAAVTGNGRGVSSLAPRAKILPVKILDANCDGFLSDEADGIIWAVSHGAQVVNLSIGGPGTSTVEIQAIQYALDNHVAVIAAAGNEGCPSATQYPAAIDGVLGVGAVDYVLQAPSFSSCGAWVDVAAPGVGIVSTMAGGSPTYGCGSDYCFLDGTSMATPYAAASVALAVSRCSISGESALAAVVAKAHDLGPPGRDDNTGAGLVDPLPVLQSGCSGAPGPTYQQLPGSDPYVRWYPNRDSGFSCDGKPVNILGTEASETIVGTSGNDVILAGGGDDYVLGGDGNDVVCAGAGNDYLRGQAGGDRLRGDVGDDTMYGDSGADDLQAGSGDDRLVGGSEADYLEGGDGFDRVYYNDHTGSVAVSINNLANSGNSTDGPSGARDRLSLGVNSVIGGPASDTLAGGSGGDRLYGGGGNDKLYGNGGNDYLSGESGADYFYGGAGIDALNAKDGIQDHYIDGGPDADSATIDRIDPTPVSATARY